MAIGDPKTDTIEAKRRRAIKYKKTDPKKYSPGFFAMFTTTPSQAADRRSSAVSLLSNIFEPSSKSAKARAKAKETSRTTTVSDKQKASSQVRKKSVRNGERDILEGEDLRKNNKPSTKSYRIVKGDTLSAIAARNDTTVAELKKLNNIKDVNKIFAGKSLKIPTRTMRTPKRKPKKMSNGGVAKKK